MESNEIKRQEQEIDLRDARDALHNANNDLENAVRWQQKTLQKYLEELMEWKNLKGQI